MITFAFPSISPFFQLSSVRASIIMRVIALSCFPQQWLQSVRTLGRSWEEAIGIEVFFWKPCGSGCKVSEFLRRRGGSSSAASFSFLKSMPSFPGCGADYITDRPTAKTLPAKRCFVVSAPGSAHRMNSAMRACTVRLEDSIVDPSEHRRRALCFAKR